MHCDNEVEAEREAALGASAYNAEKLGDAAVLDCVSLDKDAPEVIVDEVGGDDDDDDKDESEFWLQAHCLLQCAFFPSSSVSEARSSMRMATGMAAREPPAALVSTALPAAEAASSLASSSPLNCEKKRSRFFGMARLYTKQNSVQISVGSSYKDRGHREGRSSSEFGVFMHVVERGGLVVHRPAFHPSEAGRRSGQQ